MAFAFGKKKKQEQMTAEEMIAAINGEPVKKIEKIEVEEEVTLHELVPMTIGMQQHLPISLRRNHGNARWIPQSF